MFLELARPKSWIWSGGVPVSFKMFKNSIGFFIQDSISALQTHKIFKNIKVVTDRRTDGQTFGPGFGPLRRSYGCNSWNFRVPDLNCNCSCADPVPEPVPMAICGVLLDRHVSKSSA